MTQEKPVKHLRWNAFLAMTRYELLWNIRKKKFLGILVVAFVLATLVLFIPVILSNVRNEPLEADPNYVMETGGGGIGSFGFLLFAIVTMMNSISGEFETGSIVPLLTKPISRTIVFFGKVFAAFLVLLATYVMLNVYMAVGGTMIYGAQNNLNLLPLYLVGSLLSTFVWMTIVLALGTLSKSSMIAALGTLGIWMGANIVTGIVSVATEQAGILSYIAGSGATGYAQGIPGSPFLGMLIPKQISTGTDAIAANLVNCALYPSAEIEFYKGIFPGVGQPLYTEALSDILLRSILVAFVYVVVFSFVAWFAFKRSEIKE